MRFNLGVSGASTSRLLAGAEACPGAGLSGTRLDTPSRGKPHESGGLAGVS